MEDGGRLKGQIKVSRVMLNSRERREQSTLASGKG